MLALHMNWRERTSWPGHDRIAAAVGVSTDTVARAIRWLQDRGLVGLVSGGTTAAVRPGVLYAGTGNLAAIYVLTVPKRRSPLPHCDAAQSSFADLTTLRRSVVKAPCARPAKPKVKGRMDRASRGQPVLPPGGSALHTCPRTRSDGLMAAQVVQTRSRELSRLSAEHVRWLVKPFTRAGWTPADLLFAIDHAPRGRQHAYTAGVRSPAGWARARLAEWLGPDGQPMVSPSQQRAADRERVLADQAGRRTARAAAADTGAAYEAGAAMARELLRRRQPSGLPPRSPHGADRARSPRPP
jgi:hypothetical protein